MTKTEFKMYRKRLNKTQKQISEILGVSIKAIHSYEQGWRSIPPHAERQMFYIFSKFRGNKNKSDNCWKINECPPETKKQCPAWEFKSGKLCWFINGTICDGKPNTNWKKKMKICRKCDVFKELIINN